MPDGDELQEIRERLDAIERHLGIVRPGGGEAPAPVPPPPAVPSPSRSLESTIGAHWLNRIGIAAVLVGAAFFLKYAFENNWIGPAGRVLIGIGCGVALLVWAEAFHARGHALFAHTLDVIGTGVLYLSIWAASQTFALIGNGAAFAAMTAVTVGVVALALRHRSEFLAGIALTGGFLTPVLLSTGVNRQAALFTYIALLDVAALVLVALHPWMRALAVAFFGTLFLYIGWAADYYSRDQMERTIGFATLFFLIFGVIPLLRRSTLVLLLPFANAIVYFTQVSVMLYDQPKHLAWYAWILAAFFLVIAAALHLRGFEQFAAAHLALALGFITIAIPLHFDRLAITLGWLVEAAVLLTLARRLRPAAVVGSIALTLGVFRIYFVDHARGLDRIATYGLAIVIFAAISQTTRRSGLAKFSIFALNFLAITVLTLEVPGDFSRSALWMIYGAMLMAVGFRRRSSYLRWLALALLGVTILKVFLYDMSELQRAYRIVSFIALGVLLLAISFAYQRKWLTMPED